MLQFSSSSSIRVFGTSFSRYRNTSDNKGDARSRQGSGAHNAGFDMEDGHKPAGKVDKPTSAMHFHVAATGRYFNLGLVNGLFLFKKDC